ncbi:TetR/AcrR family transcriptional regulator [Arthrobacter sp. JSM 101049]|uniref:TetR/AcrR family transcriptional regulator n=1 Tax=Arthrobacter sp. JSM 101049 TaxID=929097 RepID=UPI00356B1C87
MDQPVAVPETALRLLVERGFDATSVDQLAEVLGMSRSTFFRRYGSKEDMVFADMDGVIEAVHAILAAPGRGLEDRVAAAALAVFDHHLGRRGASLLRFRLLREVPALRDRELVSTHRYERAFRHGMRAALGVEPGLDAPNLAITAYAASVVAVHNAFLRSWLTAQDDGLRTRLAAELATLAALHHPRLEGTAAGPAPGAAQPGPAVVVTVSTSGAGTDEVLAAVREALEGQDHPA